MTFLAPAWLLLLVPVAGLVAAYVVLQRRRRHYAARFTNLDLLASVAPRRPGWRRHITAAAAAVSLVSLVVALARPARHEQVTRDEATVMLAVDTSASMTATDVAPSRLAAAQAAAAEFIEDLPDTFQVGLVAFDATARVLATPTTDHQSVIAAVGRLQAGAGTATGDGLQAAVDAVTAARTSGPVADTGNGEDRDEQTGVGAEPPPATVVLLADGATTVGRPLDAAIRAAAERGIPVSTIAYGTETGTVTVEGQVVPVPADTGAMADVAEQTGGTAFTASSAGELTQVYDDIQSRIGTVTEQREVLRTFVGVAVVALVAAATGSLLWSARFL